MDGTDGSQLVVKLTARSYPTYHLKALIQFGYSVDVGGAPVAKDQAGKANPRTAIGGP